MVVDISHDQRMFNLHSESQDHHQDYEHAPISHVDIDDLEPSSTILHWVSTSGGHAVSFGQSQRRYTEYVQVAGA